LKSTDTHEVRQVNNSGARMQRYILRRGGGRGRLRS